jgi:hypothetical protein
VVTCLPSRTPAAPQIRAPADRKQELFLLNVFADEPEHFFVVHQRLLSITTGYEQDIK